MLGLDVHERVDELGATVAEALLAEHRCYLSPLSLGLDEGWVHALAHITGGGLTDNVPRVLPAGTAARIERGSWPVPPLFELARAAGDLDRVGMYRVFNMGIGMVVISGGEEADLLQSHLGRIGQPHYRIGEIVEGSGKVHYGPAA